MGWFRRKSKPKPQLRKNPTRLTVKMSMEELMLLEALSVGKHPAAYLRECIRSKAAEEIPEHVQRLLDLDTRRENGIG